MSDWHGSVGRGARIGETILWAGAGLIVLAVHAGAVAWILRTPPPAPPASAATDAIMIELAPEPMAREVEDDLDLAPDPVMMQQIESVAEDQPDQATKEFVEPELKPVEKVSEEAEPEGIDEPVDETDPVQEPVETAAEEVDVPIPTPRPTPPQRVAEREQPKRQQAEPAPRTTAPPKVEAEKAERTAAAQNTRGRAAPRISPARWQSRLLAHLERRKRYPAGPKRRREEGVVYVKFRIDSTGNVLLVSLARSSGFPELDQSVLKLVRRASPVPAPPAGVSKSITAPVQFSIR